MKQNTGNDLVTRPKNPLGPVAICVCGRHNDSGICRECPDCQRPVRGISGSTSASPYDFRPMYEAEREAMRDTLRVVEGGLSPAARYSLGLFVAQEIEDDVREAKGL